MTVSVRGMTPLIQVFDMPTSLQYYCDRLGFELVQSDGPGEPHDWALLRLGDAHLMLNTAYEADSRPPARDPTRVSAPDGYVLCFHWPATEGS